MQKLNNSASPAENFLEVIFLKKMGILGPNGTHSEEAAIYFKKFLSEEVELVICPEIFEILSAVEEGRLDSGFVPVENSLEGSINITLDTLARTDSLQVTHELIWPVHNCLMTKNGVTAIKKIFSHAQPISQCRKYLRKNFPDAEIISTPSTARAAEIVATSQLAEGFAAICTKRAGELNNLVEVAEEIQDNMANSTRFFEVERENKNLRGDKVLIICQIDGKKSGALYEILEEFAIRKVNMTRIESRPARTELGEYIFFFDLETDVDEKILNESIESVRKKSIWLKNLGKFPVITAKK